MGIKGLEGTLSLSEKSKKALQSETWQKVGDVMKEKKEVKHFTTENTAEYAYGWSWHQVVKEYLKNGYDVADNSSDIVVNGETYKTLRRLEVTVFYNAAGDTLFDVTNERLKKEYEWLMNGRAGEAAENMDIGKENDADGKDVPVVKQTEKDTEAGEAPQTERAEEDEQGGASDVIGENAESKQETPESKESKGASKHDSIPVKQRAEEKLKKELAAAKDKSFADPIIGYLLERCRADEGLAKDVVQEHKMWHKCFDYIYSQARKQTKGNCVFVRDEVVYEWAEDYYHKDDKAEEEKKAKEAAERKKEEKERKKKAAEQKKVDKKKQDMRREKKAEEKPVEKPKPKKDSKEIDGQMDLFSIMGI